MTRFSHYTAVVLSATLVAACGSGAADVPTEEVRSAIAQAIQARGDTLTLTDPRTDQPVPLAFDYVHDGVDATPGGRYVACVDFRDAQGTAYDVDYYVGPAAGGFTVEDIVMHKAGEEDVLPARERARLDSLPG